MGRPAASTATIRPRRWLRSALQGLLAWVLAGAMPLAAQGPQPARAATPLTPTAPDSTGWTPGGGVLFLASAALPGSGQYLGGDQRWAAYGAAEVWGWVSYLQQRRNARNLEHRYRDVAWRVARRASEGVRRDTVFEYYEAMSHYASSGAFDMDPGRPGVQPERQTGTFNGDIWALARAIHGGAAMAPGSPEYERALAYYMSRAIPPGYAWAWGASRLEQQVFVDLIAESDAAFRSASRYLGVILVNHLASAVDALITARLRQLGADALRFESGPVRDAPALRWEYGVRLVF